MVTKRDIELYYLEIEAIQYIDQGQDLPDAKTQSTHATLDWLCSCGYPKARAQEILFEILQGIDNGTSGN